MASKYTQDVRLWMSDAPTGRPAPRCPRSWRQVPARHRFDWIAHRAYLAAKVWPSSMVMNMACHHGAVDWNPVNQVARYWKGREMAKHALTVFADEAGLAVNKYIPALIEVINGGKQVKGEVLMAYVMLCRSHGLEPMSGHAALVKGAKPHVTVDGWTHIMNAHPQYDGCEFVEQHAEGNPLEIYAITCKVYRKDRGRATEATEYMAECNNGSGPWRSHPRRMLRHRAMMQAARMAFGLAVREVDDLAAGISTPESQGAEDYLEEQAPAQIEHVERPDPFGEGMEDDTTAREPEAEAEPVAEEPVPEIVESGELFPSDAGSGPTPYDKE